MAGHSKIRLTIPRQDLDEFTLFELTAGHASEWAGSLPVSNTQRLAEILSRALADLNRIHLSPETRFSILEALRPSIDMSLAGVCKKYLNQPLVMPAEPARIAGIARQLFAAASVAYTVVAVETIQYRAAIRNTSPARLACESIQRALHYCGLKVLQAYQLYRPVDASVWQNLHQLYALAEDQELANLPVSRPSAVDTSIKSTYLQAVLLSCCKPNQLRQSDMSAAYEALATAGALAELLPPQAGSGLFVVDLAGQQAPVYSSRHTSPLGAGARYINTEKLVALVDKTEPMAESLAESTTPIKRLPAHLLAHLASSLGSMRMRNFKRSDSASMIRICIGLSSAHYHVAGRQDFSMLLEDSDLYVASEHFTQSNPFMSPLDQLDVMHKTSNGAEPLRNSWLPGQQPDNHDAQHLSAAHDSSCDDMLEEVEVQLPMDQRYPTFHVKLADASPGGYCLEWTEELPGELRAGDIISVMEELSDHWSIAVIRWLSRLENSQTLIGLELLSPRAVAFAALIHQKDGSKAAPMRALLLPEIKLVGQPQTLITSRSSFRERQRVTLVNRGETNTVRLTRQVAATASYSQYEFQFIKELGDVLTGEHRNPLDTPYDSVWSNI
jgi:hypothetical protein